MHKIDIRDVTDALDLAINNRLCVDSWLGIGCALFIGFDDKLLLPSSVDAIGLPSPFQLKTDYADWWIEQSDCLLASSTDGQIQAEYAAYKLIGRRALSWQFIESSLALAIKFDCNFELKIVPMKGSGVLHKGAWNLRMPDDCYRYVKWDGITYLKHKDELASLEF